MDPSLNLPFNVQMKVVNPLGRQGVIYAYVDDEYKNKGKWSFPSVSLDPTETFRNRIRILATTTFVISEDWVCMLHAEEAEGEIDTELQLEVDKCKPLRDERRRIASLIEEEVNKLFNGDRVLAHLYMVRHFPTGRSTD